MSTDMVVIPKDDARYPAALRHIYSPPLQLYVRGNVELLKTKHMLAVVGSRRASAYGQSAIKKLLTPAVRAGLPLVSGLAYGIDSMAHRLCLELNTPTIAILGSGLDEASLYPSAHRQLAKRIVEQGGAVITEYPAGTKAQMYYFPARNRIVSGLTAATLVVQAAERSGSLITARLALEQGKDVFAVPGPITDPLSAGTNQLIQQGAAPAIAPEDILEYFHLTTTPAAPREYQLTGTQQRLLQMLTAQPQHIDAIVQQTNLPAPTVSAALIELEMLDIAQNLGGMKYVKSA